MVRLIICHVHFERAFEAGFPLVQHFPHLPTTELIVFLLRYKGPDLVLKGAVQKDCSAAAS